jgi:hypothetical protein
MAFSEAERVALYWPKHALQTFCEREIPPAQIKSPAKSASTSSVTLDGGCLLYRLSKKSQTARFDTIG